MVRVNIDDQDVVELALMRLPRRMSQELAGIEVFDADAPIAVGHKFHGIPLGLAYCGAAAVVVLRRTILITPALVAGIHAAGLP
jgi:hypothetical protein